LIFLDTQFLRNKTKEMFYFVYLKATYAEYKSVLVEVEGVVSSLSVVTSIGL
jgi:hypothetical protein